MKHTHKFWWIGVTGVHPNEGAAAKRASVAFEIPLLLVSAWILLRWYVSESDPTQSFDRSFDVLLLGLFILESITVCSLVTDKRRYLMENWVNLAIIVLGLPLLAGFTINLAAFRLLRVLIVISLLLQLSRSLKKLLSYNQLGLTLLACIIVIVLAGMAMSQIDPGIKTPLDGIWWAWVTVSTVGYGDVVPVTLPGRILGSFIILLGMGLVALLTANIAAFLITQSDEEKRFLSNEQSELHHLELMENRLKMMEEKLDRLLQASDDNTPKEKHEKTDPTTS